jgi:hypothetical protein
LARSGSKENESIEKSLVTGFREVFWEKKFLEMLPLGIGMFDNLFYIVV